MTYHSKVSEIPYIENYMALMVSIFAGVNPEGAFKRLGLSGNAKKRRAAKHWDDATIEKAAELKNSGLKWLEVGDVLGIDEVDSLRTAVKKKGVFIEKVYRTWNDEDIEKVAEMRNAGMAWKEIAKEFDTTPVNISSIYNKRARSEK